MTFRPTQRGALAAAIATALSAPAFAQESTQDSNQDSTQAVPVTASPVLDRISIVGGSAAIRDVAGSAHVLDHETLETIPGNDPMKVLREVPGVYVTEEEGHGLFPNISIRGANQDRNSRITVMEDGVMIAPAPYAAPAAYYFPNIARMDSVEVRKGSSSIEYGPYTIGGALNMTSTPIPGEAQGRVRVSAGERDGRRLHAWYGDSEETFGYLLETYQDTTDGFRDLDTPQRGTDQPGYEIQNYLGKFRLNSPASAERYQELELKLARDDKTIDETYLGLTREDYEATPYRRYAGSAIDEMNTKHTQYQLRHFIEVNPDLDVTTTLYRNEFHRNWYKLASVDGNGISGILADPDAYAGEMSWITGANSDDLRGTIKANNREYVSQGIESRANWHVTTGDIDHHLKFGLRYHEDEIDRFQWQDEYDMVDGSLVLTDRGALGDAGNRVTEAKTIAAFVQDRMDFGRLAVTPGLRYESISIDRTRYADADRSTISRNDESADYNVLIPGLGATFDVNENWQLLGGIYKGFAPTGVGEADEEEAINWEAGVRYQNGAFQSELIGFLNDYENLVGQCTASTGGGCDIGDTFDGGEAQVRGLEALALYDLAAGRDWAVNLPLRVAYTWTDTEFQNSFDSDYGAWGDVNQGDELPNTPEHQLSVSAGVVGERFGVHATANYVGETRAVAGSGSIPADEKVDARTIFDLSANYRLTKHAKLFAEVENLTDETYVAAIRPAGFRVGKPRTVMVGAQFDF
ncbi:TonB-dependent receptor [Guyparkeria sp. SB14A]|uniref:TonB-dependent receptor family protein n=1 Tax=Guyparkeria sp. SB14A TaxID=2571147 RepID=UPI0010ACE158|nr:TonB-dependent receptor [Guyparkeria sp. SB14A]TKA90010.1 TonB-dependent receptor [Guyparkeria sp. SB14A]